MKVVFSRGGFDKLLKSISLILFTFYVVDTQPFYVAGEQMVVLVYSYHALVTELLYLCTVSKTVSACVCMCGVYPSVCALFLCKSLWRSEKDVGAPGIGVTDDYEPSWCLELNLSPVQEQQMVLTTEPSLQPLHTHF